MKINKERVKLLGVAIFFTIFLFASVKAELFIGQTESEYNIGDNFNISMTLKSSNYASDFFSADLVCGEQEVNLYKAPYTLNAGDEKQILISTKLERFVVGGLIGECSIRTRYNGEESRSQRFILTKDIDVSLSLNNAVFNPGESVKIEGNAEKSRDRPLEGFIEFFVEELDYSFYGEVDNGRFGVNFTIPQSSLAREYTLKARVYEKDNSGEIINEGNAEENIKVRQVMKEIGIATDAESVMPKNSLDYGVVIYDQAGEEIDADVGVVVYKPDKTIFEKKLVKSGEQNAVKIEANYTPGNWEIHAKLNELEKRKTFYVEELRELEYSLDNRTLIVKNTGNVPFSGPIEISIGGITEIKELSNLDVGESKRFRLVAPDGEYSIEVGDGNKKQTLGTAFLTGKAISIDNFGRTIASSNYWILLWVLIILILVIIIIYFYKKIQKKKAFGEPLFGKSAKPVDLAHGDASLAKKLEAKSSQSSIIEKGEKQESVVIALNIKNPRVLDERDSPALKSLGSVLWKAKEAGARVYADGDFRIIVFTSLLPKDKDNILKAVSFGQTVERMLREHNKRYAQKISFGIGVNMGSLIVEARGGKFMAVDNTISSTKRISQHSSGEVLITEAIHRGTAGRIKSGRLGEKNLWRVEKVIDRSEHQEFIRRFTEKQAKDSKR